MELIDIFDSSFNYVGYEERDIVHKKGLWHQTFHCWIVRKKCEKEYLLFQKRASNKLYFPSLFDVTAAGHLLKGEKIEDGFREVEEELGIIVDLNWAKYLGLRVEIHNINSYIDREFQHVYLVNDGTPLVDFKLNVDEVCSLIEVELKDACKLFWHELPSISCRYVGDGGDGEDKKQSIVLSDFVPRNINYYRTIIIMAERYLQGDLYLSV